MELKASAYAPPASPSTESITWSWKYKHVNKCVKFLHCSESITWSWKSLSPPGSSQGWSLESITWSWKVYYRWHAVVQRRFWIHYMELKEVWVCEYFRGPSLKNPLHGVERIVYVGVVYAAR